jgi:hypothetical protein
MPIPRSLRIKTAMSGMLMVMLMVKTVKTV